MENSKKSKLPILLIFASFAVALALRLIRLGALPLGDLEASIALQALAAGRHDAVTFGPFAAYVGLTYPGSFGNGSGAGRPYCWQWCSRSHPRWWVFPA
jgi:hypothetical protein